MKIVQLVTTAISKEQELKVKDLENLTLITRLGLVKISSC
jgi:hypothetical protein